MVNVDQKQCVTSCVTDFICLLQCVIDLQKNQLIIGTTGTSTSFLPENQLPSHARINSSSQEPIDDSEDHQLAKALQKSAEEAAGWFLAFYCTLLYGGKILVTANCI